MMKRIVVLGSAAALFVAVNSFAQGRGQEPQREAPAPNVTLNQLLKPAQAPQNWLTYGGSFTSQRYSPLTQITPANAKDLELKWVFQSRSLEKHEVTPLVVDGVMYTVQGINDVFALDAATGKTIWT